MTDLNARWTRLRTLLVIERCSKWLLRAPGVGWVAFCLCYAERPMGYLNDESEQLFLIFFFQFECSIPFFSLFVKDVYFLNEGHSNRFEISFFNVHNSYFLLTWFSSLSIVCVIIYHNWMVNGAFLSIFLRRLPNGHINFEVETSFVSISHLPTFHKAS